MTHGVVEEDCDLAGGGGHRLSLTDADESAMIDREHDLSITKQAQAMNISRRQKAQDVLFSRAAPAQVGVAVSRTCAAMRG
jgi:hypothetical protein